MPRKSKDFRNLIAKACAMVICSQVCDWNNSSSAQIQQKFEREAPVAWSYYREFMSRPVRIDGKAHVVLPFQLFRTDKEHTLFKTAFTGYAVDLISGNSSKKFFSIIHKGNRWVDDQLELQVAKKHLEQSVERHVFRLLEISGSESGPCLFIDQLFLENKLEIKTVLEKTVGGESYVEVVFKAKNGSMSELVTVVLQPEKLWTLKSARFVNEGGEKTIEFETASFYGIPVPFRELTTNVSTALRSSSQTVIERIYQRTTDKEFDSEFNKSIGLVDLKK